MAENTAALLGTFNFRVTLRRSATATSGAAGTTGTPGAPTGTPLGEGGFQECTGLEVEMDVAELVEGGRNDGVIRRVGRGKYGPLVLKRGMFVVSSSSPQSRPQANAELWSWLQGIVSGVRPVVRYDGVIEVLDAVGNRDAQNATVLASWRFSRGLPVKLSGPSLNAKTGDIAMEELHIAHEGLSLVVPR